MRFYNENALTAFCFAIYIMAFAASLMDVVGVVGAAPTVSLVVQGIALAVTIISLLYGSIAYQLTRFGAVRRTTAHHPVAFGTLTARYTPESAPSVLVLIPSYKEERRVVRQTVLSAALAEYPRRRVVVLLDDPPMDDRAPDGPLASTRRMIAELDAAFDALAKRLAAERETFLIRIRGGAIDLTAESSHLAMLYDDCAAWIEQLGAEFCDSNSPSFGHANRLFIREVIGIPAARHRQIAATLRDNVASLDGLTQEYARLTSRFALEITSFERKTFENLSHQPNKAMNINSYLGLIGGFYRLVARGTERPWLVRCEPNLAAFRILEADYVLTLDADSVILNDYILRLVHEMERDEGLAVAQTPYSSFPGALSVLERVAGATTDIQYLVHQGFTAFGATFWVGANALLRLSALRDIKEMATERGHSVPIFVQDRTVIEDTGSTIDLVARGWRLYNYPERLAYSATPPDFGSLIIQRRRWANGGLIILPDLIKLTLRRNAPGIGVTAFALRAHYLCGPLLGNLAFVVLLITPFDPALSSPWFPIAAVPYFVLYARDLQRTGYRLTDLANAYALTLLLVPVNLTGVALSLRQLITGRKSAFGRTPKVDGRTAASSAQIVLQACLLAVTFSSFPVNLLAHRYAYAAFGLINTAFLVYGITSMIGWAAAWEDVTRPLRWVNRVRGRGATATEVIVGRKADDPVLPNLPRDYERVIIRDAVCGRDRDAV